VENDVRDHEVDTIFNGEPGEPFKEIMCSPELRPVHIRNAIMQAAFTNCQVVS